MHIALGLLLVSLLQYCPAAVGHTLNENMASTTLPLYANGSISAGHAVAIYKFTFSQSIIWIRVTADGNPKKPVFVVVRGESRIYSWTVPHLTEDNLETNTEARTFCLDGSMGTVELSTSSITASFYWLEVTQAGQYVLQLGEVVQASVAPLDRRVYFFAIPETESGAMVKVESSDDKCAIVSIEPSNCTDAYAEGYLAEESNVNIDVTAQTMTKQAAITISRNKQELFNIIVYIPASSTSCALLNAKTQNSLMEARKTKLDKTMKNFTLVIEGLNTKSYLAIAWLPLVVLGISAVVLFLCIFPPTAKLIEYPEKPIYQRPERPSSEKSYSPNIVKGSFLSSLIVIAVFYIVPAFQLLYYHQLIYRFSGDQDQCYFNFLCIRPVGSLVAFNNVYSNISYVLFGLSFLVLVRYHSRRFSWRYREIFYALGVALVLEGILSACYHVCPTPHNFQFDTTFMLIIAGLCIYHLYHVRNPHEPGRPHTFFGIFAVAIVSVVFGILSDESVFRIVIAVVYALIALLIGAIVTKKMYLENEVFKEHPKAEKILTGIHIVINLALIAYSIATLIQNHAGFPTSMLAIFIVNLFFFVIFYVVMKYLLHENTVVGTFLCLIGSLGSWGAALYFYIGRRVSSWSDTPAVSRAENKECAWFDFFDYHDIWHFLSAFGLFVSFILLLNLDVGQDVGYGNTDNPVASEDGYFNRGSIRQQSYRTAMNGDLQRRQTK